METDYTGKKVITRSYAAGVFYGTLKEREGQEVVLQNARRLWYWDGACTVSELAVNGVAKPDDCKFTVAVDEICLLKVEEIIPCTPEAVNSIESVKVWDFHHL